MIYTTYHHQFSRGVLLFALLLFMVATKAQDKEDKKQLMLSGSVDTYFQTNLTAPDDIPQSFGTAFADQLGFSLGMANLIARYDKAKTGGVADLTFGPRGDTANGGFNVNQIYVYWRVTDKAKLTLGRFNTYLGHEVISPLGNFNYSSSYEFSNGPFSHVGLKADFALTKDLNLMLALMNVTDTNNNLTGAYAGGAQIGYKGQSLNFYYDAGEVLGFEIDYTGGFNITEAFRLGINAAYDENDQVGFIGASLYPELTLKDNVKVGARAEYFARLFDLTENDPQVFAFTLTGSYQVENLIIKPELRVDTWGNNTKPYFDVDGNPSNRLASFLVAAIYSF